MRYLFTLYFIVFTVLIGLYFILPQNDIKIGDCVISVDAEEWEHLCVVKSIGKKKYLLACSIKEFDWLFSQTGYIKDYKQVPCETN